MQEWQGWSFTTMSFWTSADTQDRGNFTRASGVFAVADPDEWDDRNRPSASGRFHSVLRAPQVLVPAGTALYLSFDSHYRQEGTQKAEVRASWNGRAAEVLMRYDSTASSANRGIDAEDQSVALTLPPPAADSWLRLEWAMLDAVNNWYWAIDNIVLGDELPPTVGAIARVGPLVRFADRDRAATVLFQTEEPCVCFVEFGRVEPHETRVSEEAPTREHSLELTGLEPDTTYQYRLGRVREGGAEEVSEPYLLETSFDWGPGPAPDRPSPYGADSLSELYENAASAIADRWGDGKGVCLVLACGEGRLAYELAKRTRLRIVGVDEDPAQVAAARRALDRAGLYGWRVAIHQADPDRLPLPRYGANLIVCDGLLRTGRPWGAAAELERVLRPSGGRILVGAPANAPHPPVADELADWISAAADLSGYQISTEAGAVWIELTRPSLAGAGEWTHFYANPANTACSEDELISHPMGILWFGRPGPRLMINRHSRPMSSLFKDGRLFCPGDDRVIALDAYNGTALWDLCVPGSRRLGAFKGSGQMVVREDLLYIAVRDHCLGVNVTDGMPAAVFPAPQLIDGQLMHWGYLASVDDLLLGTGQDPAASFYDYTALGNADLIEGDDRALMISEYIFALDRQTQEERWRHREGSILNSTVTIGGGRLYFLENAALPVATGPWEGPGRRTVSSFCQGGARLVALDLRTGEVLWREPVVLPYSQMMYLSYSREILLFVGSFNQNGHAFYGLIAHDAATGRPAWKNQYDSGYGTGGSHGEQWQRPVIADGVIYMLNASAYDLATGAKRPFSVSRGAGGCGTISGSKKYLFARGSNPRMYAMRASGSVSGDLLTSVTRPGCFINIIPAGGLVMIPESSSGCTCDYPLQMSVVFAPR